MWRRAAWAALYGAIFIGAVVVAPLNELSAKSLPAIWIASSRPPSSWPTRCVRRWRPS
jgi:hypothetical protein